MEERREAAGTYREDAGRWNCLEAGEDCFTVHDALEEDDVFY